MSSQGQHAARRHGLVDRRRSRNAPYLTVLALIAIGDALRDTLDPRARERRVAGIVRI